MYTVMGRPWSKRFCDFGIYSRTTNLLYLLSYSLDSQKLLQFLQMLSWFGVLSSGGRAGGPKRRRYPLNNFLFYFKLKQKDEDLNNCKQKPRQMLKRTLRQVL